MDFKKIDDLLSHIFNMAGKSELQSLDYENKEFIDGSKIKTLTIGDYKALRKQIIGQARYKSLLLFHYEGSNIDTVSFMLNGTIDEVVLYIRDKNPDYIKIIAEKLSMSTIGVYKLINRIEAEYLHKMKFIWDDPVIHKLLGLKK